MAEAGPGGAGAGGAGEQNCIFCHIVSGKVQSKKIYDDSECIGILDINPANPGHVLILPKKHYSIMPQMNEIEIGHLFMVSKSMSGALLKALKVEGTNIFVANGAVAGQKAPHLMIHVIPRKDGDGLNFTLPEYKISIPELLKVRDMLLPRIKVNLSVSDKDIEKIKGAQPSVSSGETMQDNSNQKQSPEFQQSSFQSTQSSQPFQPQNQGMHGQEGNGEQADGEGNVDLDAISNILKPVTTHTMHQNIGMPLHHGQYGEQHESRNSQMLARDEAEQMREKQTERQMQKKKISLNDIDDLFASRGK